MTEFYDFISNRYFLMIDLSVSLNKSNFHSYFFFGNNMYNSLKNFVKHEVIQ